MRQRCELPAGPQPDADPQLDADPQSVADQQAVTVSNPTPSARPAKWGLCGLPHCGYAFHPVLGSRGPFLACNRKACQNTRDLSAAEPWLD